MARLPTPGSDNGTWGDVLNDYLQVSHDSEGLLKPGVVNSSSIQDNSITAAKLAASGGSDGQVLTKDTGQAGGVKWADVPSSNSGPIVFPLSGYGLVAASDNPIAFGSVSGVNEGNVWITRIWVEAGVAFTKIAMAIGISGSYSSSSVPNRLGWYDDNGVLQEATPDDSAMWSGGSGTWYVGTLPTPVSAQSTGRFIYVGFIMGGFSGVSPYWNINSGFDLLAVSVGSSRRRTMFATGQTTLPSSFNPTSFGSSTGFIPLVGLVA